MALSNVAVSPSSLSSDQNNWNPGSGSFYRITASAPVNITGLAGGTDGLIRTFVNVGSNDFVFQHQNAGSSASNRVVSATGADATISAGNSLTVQYDSVSSLWREVGRATIVTGTGANTALSNLGSVAVNTSLLPGTDNSINLGSASKQWKDAFLSGAVTVSSLSTGVLHSNGSGLFSSSAVSLTADISGVLPVANGGTNSSTALSGSTIMVSNGTAVVQGAAGTTTTVLHGNASGAPSYGAVSLTADVSGTLPIANGGTGSATQNFVDLTTGQTVAGIKSFSSAINANGGIQRSTSGSISIGTDSNTTAITIGTSAGVLDLWNATLRGTTTTINSSVVDVVDRVIHVNHSGSIVGVPTAIAGLSVHRGNTAAATGSLTAVDGSSLTDATTLILNDGVHAATTFEFDSGGGVTGSNVAIAFTGGDSDTTVATAIRAAINGVGANLGITASGSGTSIVLTNDEAGSMGNVTITGTAAATLSSSGMSGGSSRDHAGVFWDESNSRFSIAYNTSGDDATVGAFLDVKMAKAMVSALQLGTSTTSGYVLTADASGNATWQAASGGTITGTGTTGYITKWSTGGSALGDSGLSDSSGNITLNGSGTLTINAFSSAGVVHNNSSGLLSTSAVSLTADVSGTLPVGNGGTGTATTFTAGSMIFAGASGVYSQNNSKLFWDNTNFRIGIQTATPSTDIGISGDVARSIALERHTTSDTAGNNLSIVAGSATSSATNKAGGDLVLSSGISTGTGASNILFQVATAGSSGTADRSPATKMQLTGAGELVPPTDDTGVIGTDSLRWNRIRANNVVTGDLDMMAKDGTAHWTLIEQIDGIRAINQKTGKSYRLMMQEEV